MAGRRYGDEAETQANQGKYIHYIYIMHDYCGAIYTIDPVA
jgi:hypothetical protein